METHPRCISHKNLYKKSKAFDEEETSFLAMKWVINNYANPSGVFGHVRLDEKKFNC